MSRARLNVFLSVSTSVGWPNGHDAGLVQVEHRGCRRYLSPEGADRQNTLLPRAWTG